MKEDHLTLELTVRVKKRDTEGAWYGNGLEFTEVHTLRMGGFRDISLIIEMFHSLAERVASERGP